MRGATVPSLLLALFAGVAAAHAQPEDEARDGSHTAVEYEVTYLTAADGLPANRVWSFAEDSAGFLWIGTSAGIVRYDGYTFEPLRSEPTDSSSRWEGSAPGFYLSNDGLHVDAAGRLWASLGVNGLLRYDPAANRHTRYTHDPNGSTYSLPSNSVQSIVADPTERDVLWISTTWPAGVSRLDVAVESHGSSLGQHLTHYPISEAPATWGALLVDRTGTPWFGTGGGPELRGLYRLDPDSGVWSRLHPHTGSRVISLYEAPSDPGGLWVGTYSGLYRFDRSTETFAAYRLPPQPFCNRVRAMLEDRSGTFWVGTRCGLFTFDRYTGAPGSSPGQGFTRFPHQLFIPEVTSLHEDRFGQVWVGGRQGGTMKIEQRVNPFRYYRYPAPPPGESWSAHIALKLPIVKLDREGALWLGSAPGRFRIDRETGAVGVWGPPSGASMMQDRSGVFWLGRCPGAIMRFHPDRPEHVTTFSHDPEDPESIAPSCFTDLVEDHTGALWVASSTDGHQGILQVDRAQTPPRFTLYAPSDSLSSYWINDLVESRSEPGVIWAGALEHLFRFDTETKQFTVYADEALGDITMVHEDRQGRLWLASRGKGLHHFDPDTGRIVETLTTQDGLVNNETWSVYEDERGFFWLSTSGGLSRFDPRSRTFRTFTERDGLPFSTFGEGSHHQGADGELVFGGPEGFVTFYPEDVVDQTVAPDVVLTGLRIDGEPVRPGSESPLVAALPYAEESDVVTLAHDRNDLTVEYVGLHFLEPEQTRYRYRLDNVDDDWIEAGAQRSVRYPDLAPGAYTFRVSARNGHSPWSEPRVLHLSIMPPPWATAWAYALYALLFAAGIFAVDRVRRRQVLRDERERARLREARLQAEAAEEKAKVLEELDRLKTHFFTNISHEFRTPLTLILGPLRDLLEEHHEARTRRRLALMQRNGDLLLRLINQLLDLARLEAGQLTLHARRADLVAFLRPIASSFASRAERREIDFRFRATVGRAELYFDAEKLEKVFLNLLSNAFKFTDAGGKIRVTVTEGTNAQTGFVEVKVRDTGAGIAAEDLPHIFDRFRQAADAEGGTGVGLALAKELTALHGGQITVESEPGFGSTFTVRLPKGRDHLNPEDILSEDAPADTPAEAGDGALGEAMHDVDVSIDEVLAGDGESNPDAPLVLVVDDNADIRAYLRDHLADAYRVEEAADGAEGLALARELKPALVVADVMMPELDGFALCRAIRDDPELRTLPVILLTARAEDESKLEGLGTGADAYLSKPFNIDEVLVLVENLITLRRQLREQYAGKVRVGPEDVVVESADAAFLRRVHEVIEAHLGDTGFTVDWLAEEVGLGRRQLRRRLKALTGVTAAGTIRKHRLERAAQLLAQEWGTVSEVAYAVGFKTPDHFSRVFRQVYGVPPSQWDGKENEV